MSWSKLAIFAGGVLFGTAGIRILSGKDAKKVYTHGTAAGLTVIMVGDGINDSPALSAADAGIAISDGSEIARQIADITVASEDLYRIVTLKDLSDLLMKRIRFNYRTIVGFNSGLIALSLLGVLSPAVSALLHNASTIALGLNSTTKLLSP